MSPICPPNNENWYKADKKLIDAIKKLNFKQAKELIKKRESIILTASTESILKEAVKEAEEKITDFPEKEQNKQESKLQKIKNLINEKLYVREDDHAPPVNDLDRAELEKAEFEKLAAASTELEKAESEAEFERLAAASAELEKVESEAKFEKLASVQDLYLDHAQPVNANISEEDVNSTTSDQITPVGSDELDSSSGEPLYSTIDSGSSDPQLDGQQSPQSEILTNTLDDDVSSLSSDEHSSASSNAGDTSTTENVIDNEEEPVVDDKDDQPAGKEGDSKSPVTFIIEGDDNKVVFEQDNSVKTHPQNAKLPVIATWTSAITGVLTGVAAPVAYFAFSASLLVAGIIAGVGACCLVAAVVIYCCTPKSQVENNEVEKSFNMKEGLTVTPV